MCDELIERGFEVLCVDNFITGNPANLDRLRRRKEFALIGVRTRPVLQPKRRACPGHHHHVPIAGALTKGTAEYHPAVARALAEVAAGAVRQLQH